MQVLYQTELIPVKVPEEGVEPTRLAALTPKASVSTNFTTQAQSQWWVSNPQPPVYKTDALPYELHWRIILIISFTINNADSLVNHNT